MMRAGPQFYTPRTNSHGLDYYSGDRREPVPLLPIPDGVLVQQISEATLPNWASFRWLEVKELLAPLPGMPGSARRLPAPAHL